MEKKVKAAYLFENGMIITFNEKGEQIPELQGPKDEILEKLMDSIDGETYLCGLNGYPLVWPRRYSISREHK